VAHIIGISCIEESPILWVLRVTGWGLKFDLAKGFVGHPLSRPSSLFLGCIHLSADLTILPAFLSGFALVEPRHPSRDGLVQLVQIDIGKQGAEISAPFGLLSTSDGTSNPRRIRLSAVDRSGAETVYR
jgi:hypothetical protein